MNIRLTAVIVVALAARVAVGEPLTIPFDFSKGAIGLDVTIKGMPAYVILDTGVDPSAIDTARADALGLKIDRGAGGEATGEGDAKEARIFPATIDGLGLAGRAVGPVDAAAMDMSALSARYGRKLDGILGYSFLTDKIVLIDYPTRTLGILDRPADALAALKSCHRHWSIPLKSFGDDNIPMIPDFRLGAATGSISLDTGSTGGISLYRAALDLPGLRAALVETGETSVTGARGDAKIKTYKLNKSIGFGPFTIPAGEVVTLSDADHSSDSRVANIGNKLFAAMSLKMLLDYRTRLMTFYGDCGESHKRLHH